MDSIIISSLNLNEMLADLKKYYFYLHSNILELCSNLVCIKTFILSSSNQKSSRQKPKNGWNWVWLACDEVFFKNSVISTVNLQRSPTLSVYYGLYIYTYIHNYKICLFNAMCLAISIFLHKFVTSTYINIFNQVD